MRKSTTYLLVMASSLALCGLMVLHAHLLQTATGSERQARAKLVRKLQLTDLCLFTEARYTRHPSMADLHAPFQDHPGALEHFPSGSLATPPLLSSRSHVQSP